jgi:tRNA threonylcarbamoyladenosine biosynthesis protein TsaB
MLVAIDTATEYASFALHDGAQVRVEETWESSRRHTVELLPRWAAALEKTDVGGGRLSGVAVTCGPGSFTGLRVGMAVAKGLALARSIPIVGVPTLDVVAAAQGQDSRPLCAVLQAGRARICAAIYYWQEGAWNIDVPPHLTTWGALVQETVAPMLFCGEIDPAGIHALTAIRKWAAIAPPAFRLRRAGFLADLAWRRLSRGETDDPAALAPIYLQHPV